MIFVPSCCCAPSDVAAMHVAASGKKRRSMAERAASPAPRAGAHSTAGASFVSCATFLERSTERTRAAPQVSNAVRKVETDVLIQGQRDVSRRSFLGKAGGFLAVALMGDVSSASRRLFGLGNPEPGP